MNNKKIDHDLYFIKYKIQCIYILLLTTKIKSLK